MEVLKRHNWPGNIRELQNVIERAVIMTMGPELMLHTTRPVRRDSGSASITTLVDVERAHIIAALCETDWIVGGPRGAAAKLGLARTTLIARMRRLGISRESKVEGREPGIPVRRPKPRLISGAWKAASGGT